MLSEVVVKWRTTLNVCGTYSRSIPSLEIDNASVLDEFYWLNKEDPNYSRCRVIEKQGQRLVTDGDFTLTKKRLKKF